MSITMRCLLPVFGTMTAGLAQGLDDFSINPAASISRTWRFISSSNFREMGHCFRRIGRVFPTSISCSSHVVRPSGASAGGSALFSRFFIVSVEAILICVGSFGSDEETQASSNPILFRIFSRLICSLRDHARSRMHGRNWSLRSNRLPDLV